MSTDQTPFEIICETADALETDPERHVQNVLNSTLNAAIRAATATGKTAKVTLKKVIRRVILETALPVYEGTPE